MRQFKTTNYFYAIKTGNCGGKNLIKLRSALMQCLLGLIRVDTVWICNSYSVHNDRSIDKEDWQGAIFTTPGMCTETAIFEYPPRFNTSELLLTFARAGW